MTSPQMRSIKTLVISALAASVPFSMGGLLTSESAQAEVVNPLQGELAQSNPAPEELTQWVSKMDETANAKRLKPFMKNFAKAFEHGDGLNKRQLKQSVKSFWKDFDQLSYSTTIDSWSLVGPGVYETVTTTKITGAQTDTITPQNLNATIRSEQRLENGKIVSQTVLEEQSQITSGDNPPTVRVNLPQTVKVGEDYFLDIIVDEPLGDRILLGAAMEEAVNSENSLNPADFDIEALATGGLFKIGQAPDNPTDQWISALLIQDGGMYLMSQRISVVSEDVVEEAEPES